MPYDPSFSPGRRVLRFLPDRPTQPTSFGPGNAQTNNWFTPGNWDRDSATSNSFPDITDVVFINIADGPTISRDGAEAGRIFIGFRAHGELTINGGVLKSSLGIIGTESTAIGGVTVTGSGSA